jgi:putative membrane protein
MYEASGGELPMKTSTRVIGIAAAVIIGLVLLAGGFWLGRVSSGLFGYGLGLRGSNFGFGMMNGFGYGGIFSIIFWIVMIGLGVWLISSLVSRPHSQPPANLPPAESALDILKKRYARGEITKEQFDEMHRDLSAYHKLVNDLLGHTS